MTTQPDYYVVLGVHEKAPPEVIKAAYHALARKYHPDTNPGTSKLGTKFQEITEAYEFLSDPVRRAAYDVGRNTARQWQAPPPPSQPPPAPGPTSYPPPYDPWPNTQDTAPPHPYWTTPRASQPPPPPYRPAPPSQKYPYHGKRLDPTGVPFGQAMNSTGRFAPAGVPRRLVAFIFDGVICTAGVIAVAFAGFAYLSLAGVNTNAHTPANAVVNFIIGISLLVVPALYWPLSWALRGQTVGGTCVGIQVAGMDGRRPHVGAAYGRFFSSLLSIVPLGLGLWWAIWDRQHRAWHDHLTGTAVWKG